MILKTHRGRVSLFWLSISLVPMILLYSNCSQFSTMGLTSADGSSTSGLPSITGQTEVVIAGEPAVGVLNYTRLIRSYASVTGMPQIAQTKVFDGANVTWQSVASGLPTDGSAALISAPSWMFIGDVAGATCSELIFNELHQNDDSQRKFFNGFAYYTSSYGADFRPLIRKLARAFWGRNETPEEQALLLAYVDAVPDSGDVEKDNTEKLSGLCTGMLASLSSVQDI